VRSINGYCTDERNDNRSTHLVQMMMESEAIFRRTDIL
jgi:hypothetical protein